MRKVREISTPPRLLQNNCDISAAPHRVVRFGDSFLQEIPLTHVRRDFCARKRAVFTENIAFSADERKALT
jgi:hypothetical protein